MASPLSDPGHVPGLRTFPWRFVAYGCVLLYLAGDLYLFDGPLHRRIEVLRGETVDAEELLREEGIFSVVNGYPIRREELDLAVSEYCLRHGLDEGSLGRKRINSIRWRVSNELDVDRLLWQHAVASPVELTAEQRSAARAELVAGFASDEAMVAEAAARGFKAGELEVFIESRAMQQAWVEAKIAKHLLVTDAELRARHAELGGEAAGKFELMREELCAVLEAEKRQWAVDGLIDHLKRKAVMRRAKKEFWVEEESAAR